MNSFQTTNIKRNCVKYRGLIMTGRSSEIPYFKYTDGGKTRATSRVN